MSVNVVASESVASLPIACKKENEIINIRKQSKGA